MTRNSALFGASVAAAVVGAAGLVVSTGGASYAAPGDTAYGVAYADPFGSSGWTTGTVTSDYGLFTATATTAGGVSSVNQVAFGAGTASGIGVTTSCVAGKPTVVVTGGGAAGTYTSATSLSLAKFAGNPTLVGSVSLLRTVGGVAVGANVDFSPGVDGSYARLGGVICAAVTTSTTTSTSSTSTSTSTSTRTSTSTTSSTSTHTSPSTSTSPTPTPTGTTTGPPIVTDGPMGTGGGTSPWLPVGGLGLALLGAGALFVNVIRTREE